MRQHTPGPWKWNGAEAIWSTGKNAKLICDFERLLGYPNNIENDANLIAAAPEMLEALKATNGWLEVLLEDSTISENAKVAIRDRFNRNEQAIAHAEGSKP